MKKTLLVAALAAGLSGVAHAEDSVTLYGLVDAGVGYSQKTVKVDGNKVFESNKFRAASNTQADSRWGMRGEEELAGGNTVFFNLESGFSITDGNSGRELFDRKALVGVKNSGWGSLSFGRQETLGYDFLGSIDPFSLGYSQASANSVFGSALEERKDNVIKYISPSNSGFTFGVGLVRETEDEDFGWGERENNSFGTSIGAKYEGAGLTLAAAYDYNNIEHKFINNGVSTKEKTNTHAWTLGGAYDFGSAKLHLMYGQQRNGLLSADAGLAGDLVANMGAHQVGLASNDGLRSQAWLAGLSANLTEHDKVMFSYQGGRLTHADMDAFKVKTHIFSLGYNHNLSKRTSVYGVASYGKSKMDNVKLTSTEFKVGLSHRF